MNEPKVKEVTEWIIALCEGQEKEKEHAARNLESLPRGYFDEHSIPKSKIKHCLNALPNVLLTTQSQDLKKWCVQLIGEFRLSSAESIRALHYALNDNSDNVLISTIWALGEIRAKGNETETLIIQKVNHPNKDVRWRVAWALSQIDYEMQDTTNALIKMLKDEYELCRGYALIALDRHPNLSKLILYEVMKLTYDSESFPRETAKKICQKYQN